MEPTPGIKLIFLGKNKDLRTNHIVRLDCSLEKLLPAYKF